MKKVVLNIAIAALAAGLLAGCGGAPGTRLYVNEEADLGFYTRVGVIPFSNFSNDRTAGEKVTLSFHSEVLAMNLFDVANSGDFARVVNKVVGQESANLVQSLTVEQASVIGAEAGVEGIFVGAVKDFSTIRAGQQEFPLVSVIVRFIDCQTGNVVWSYEVTRRGGPKLPILPFGETYTMGAMTTKVCREVAEAFAATAR